MVQKHDCISAISRTIGALPAAPPAGATAATAGGSDVPRLGTCIRRRPAAGCCRPAARQPVGPCFYGARLERMPASGTCNDVLAQSGAPTHGQGRLSGSVHQHWQAACSCRRCMEAGCSGVGATRGRRRPSDHWRPSRHAAAPLHCGMFRALQQGAEPTVRFPDAGCLAHLWC